MPLMNRLNARAVAILGTGKYNHGAGLLLHKQQNTYDIIKNVVKNALDYAKAQDLVEEEPKSAISNSTIIITDEARTKNIDGAGGKNNRFP
nr:hypothetical protein [Bartonella vinsonii]